MSGPLAALALCRALHDAATLVLWGAFAYLAALVPAGLRRLVELRLGMVRIAAVALAAATTLATLPLQAAVVGDGWADARSLGTLGALLAGTAVGRAWEAGAVAALLLAATVAAPAAWRSIAVAAAAALLLATQSLTGHAAMQGGVAGLLHGVNDTVHLLAGGAWLGALVPLAIILRRPADPDAAVALRGFSRAGHLAVALVIGTGCVNMGLVLGRWPTDWTSPYQALLALKLALVAVMVGLAIANRYLVLPRMRRHPAGTVAALRVATLVELAIGLGVVACVGIVGLLDPG